MHICPSSMKDFEVYVDTLQAQTKGDHPTISEGQLDKIKTVIIPILNHSLFASTKKIQENFSVVRELIDQNTLKETPGLLEQVAKIEKEITYEILQLEKLHLLSAEPAAPEKPQEKKLEKSVLDVLSPLSKLEMIPLILVRIATIEDSYHVVWTKKGDQDDELVINIQEGKSHQKGLQDNKIGICVKKTPGGMIVRALFIDSAQSESKEIPDRWLGLVRDAVSLIMEFCV